MLLKRTTIYCTIMVHYTNILGESSMKSSVVSSKKEKQKRFLKKTVALIAVVAATAAGVGSEGRLAYAEGQTSLNIEYHTQAEIKQFISEHPVRNLGPQYSSQPGGTYQGALTSEVDQDALNAINQIRYIAGLSSNITIDPEQESKAQAAAYVNNANNTLSHYPSRPAGWGSEYDSVYNLGREGAGSSNLGWASYTRTLADNVFFGWMHDGDNSNIDRVGHRRWVINPYMTTTGFGQVGGYTAMYSFGYDDDAFWYHGAGGQVSVWPAPNTPISYFRNDEPWSYSSGTYESGDVRVTLTRTSTGQVWNFSNSGSDGYFNVENSNYGLKGCVIFRPNGIAYSAGDRFNVEITGLSGGNLNYTVEFFDLNSVRYRNLEWEHVNGKSYWYENDERQGTYSDSKCFSYDGTLRGREIYDPASDGWYWLDVNADGAKAIGKEVFMPYIYQNQKNFSEAEILSNAAASGADADGNYEHAELSDQVVKAIKNGTGKWVRYDNNGMMLKGWVKIEGELASLYPDQVGNVYYYDRKTGLMAKGETVIGGKTYYFDETTGVLK